MISKTVLKVKICEKYKISSILLNSRREIFENASILWINATRMNIIALKMHILASITNNKIEQFPNYSSYKIL